MRPTHFLAALCAAFVLAPVHAQEKTKEPKAPPAAKQPEKAAEKQSTDSLLDVARSLQPKFKDASYGKDTSKGQVNDATFVLAVLDAGGIQLDAASKSAVVKIGDLGGDAKQAEALVGKNDAQLSGVVGLLIDRKLAKKVETADVAPGDLIQYWKRNDKKEWYGYVFVVESVEKDKAGENPKVKLFGAHEGNASIGKSGPVGTSRFELTLKAEDDRRIFLARCDKNAAKAAVEAPKGEPKKKDAEPAKKGGDGGKKG